MDELGREHPAACPFCEWRLTSDDEALAAPRWLDALREIAEHDYLDGDECRRIAKEALA